MNDQPNRSWSALTTAARRDKPPAVDVQHTVMEGIRRSPVYGEPQAPLSLLAAIDALTTRRWTRPAFALLTALACGIGYGGYRGSVLVEMVSSLLI